MPYHYFLFGLFFLISSCSSNDNPFSYGNDTHSRGNMNIYVEGSFKPLFDTSINTFEGQYPKAKISAVFVAEDEIIAAFFKDSTKTICISRDFTKEEKSALKKNKVEVRSDKIAEDAIALKFNMGKREIREFIDKWIKD